MEKNNCNSCTETATFLEENQIDYSSLDKFLHSLEQDDAVFSGVLDPVFSAVRSIDFLIVGVACVFIVVLAF